jgi:hypothetical protein
MYLFSLTGRLSPGCQLVTYCRNLCGSWPRIFIREFPSGSTTGIANQKLEHSRKLALVNSYCEEGARSKCKDVKGDARDQYVMAGVTNIDIQSRHETYPCVIPRKNSHASRRSRLLASTGTTAPVRIVVKYWNVEMCGTVVTDLLYRRSLAGSTLTQLLVLQEKHAISCTS